MTGKPEAGWLDKQGLLLTHIHSIKGIDLGKDSAYICRNSPEGPGDIWGGAMEATVIAGMEQYHRSALQLSTESWVDRPWERTHPEIKRQP